MKTGDVIFREPPEDIDETWTHGALLGGMVGYDDEALARSYFTAGSLLVDHVLSTGERGQALICPILYVYRHGVELYLKVIVPPDDFTHSLGGLLSAFCQHVHSRYNEKVPPWVTRPVTQLAQIDPGSDLFRYGKTRSSASKRMADQGEFWVDLRTLKRTVLQLEYAFLRVLVADAHGLDLVDQIGPKRPASSGEQR